LRIHLNKAFLPDIGVEASFQVLNQPKGPKMESSHSGPITPFHHLRLVALGMGSTLPHDTSLRMQSIGSWWYKDPMLWIVVLLIIGIVILKARKDK